VAAIDALFLVPWRIVRGARHLCMGFRRRMLKELPQGSAVLVGGIGDIVSPVVYLAAQFLQERSRIILHPGQ